MAFTLLIRNNGDAVMTDCDESRALRSLIEGQGVGWLGLGRD